MLNLKSVMKPGGIKEGSSDNKPSVIPGGQGGLPLTIKEVHLTINKEKKMNRPELQRPDFEAVIETISKALFTKLGEKGWHISVSAHEILGLTEEEFHEFASAVHANDHGKMRAELLDLAVACLFGVASIDSEKMDW